MGLLAWRKIEQQLGRHLNMTFGRPLNASLAPKAMVSAESSGTLR